MKIRMVDGFEAEIKTAKIVKRFPEFKKLAHRFDARNYLVSEPEFYEGGGQYGKKVKVKYRRMNAVVIIGDNLFRFDGPVRNVWSFRECILVSDRERIF